MIKMSKSFIILVSIVVFVTVAIVGCQAQLPEGCACATTDEYDPVCGNDGMTYANLMTLRCADKCVKYSIHLMHHGPCKT